MALQNAESRGESFSKEDFLEGRVGARMIPEDFNFEENVSYFYYIFFFTNYYCELEFPSFQTVICHELEFVLSGNS